MTDMTDECKICSNADNEYCFACDNGNQFKPLTNADRLRSMSDEELATYLVTRSIDAAKEIVKAYGMGTKISYDLPMCVSQMLKWLKRPMEVDK